MKQGILFCKVLMISFALLIVSPGATVNAQHRHGNPITGQGVSGKKVKQKKSKEKVIRTKGSASKAVKKQEKKAEQREKDNARADSKLKSRHFSIQNYSTQYRMVNNERQTNANYKAKQKRIRRESHKPKRQHIEKP